MVCHFDASPTSPPTDVAMCRHACHRASCRDVPWSSRAIPVWSVDEEPTTCASPGATFLSQVDHAKAYGRRRRVTSRSPHLSPWNVIPSGVMFDFRDEAISATLARVEKGQHCSRVNLLVPHYFTPFPQEL